MRGPTIGVLCEPPLSGGWRRRRVARSEIPSGVEVVRTWDAVDMSVRTAPVVVLDPGVSP